VNLGKHRSISQGVTLLVIHERLVVERDLVHYRLIDHRWLISSSHLTHKDPDQPETKRQQDHEAVPNETEETITLFLYNINNRHVSSFLKYKLKWLPEV
jgi:hypothetical protein